MGKAVAKLYFAIKEFDKGRNYEYTFNFRKDSIVFRVEDPKSEKRYSWCVTVKEVESMHIDIIKEYIERMVDSF